MRKTILVLILTFFLTSCNSPSVFQKDDITIDKFNSDFMPTFPLKDEKMNVTSSNKGIYKLESGVVSFYDIVSKKKVDISKLNVADDSYFESNVCPNYKKYCEIVNQRFFQFYNDRLFYITRYESIEGESSFRLNYLNQNGTESYTLLKLDGHPDVGNMRVYNEYLLYIETFGSMQDLYVVNLNSGEKQKIDYANNDNIDFISFQQSENDLFIHTFNIDKKTHVFSRMNFEKLNLEKMFEDHGGIWDGYGEKILTFKVNESLSPGHSFQIVDFKNNVIKEIDPTQRVRYIDKNYVYASSMESPQIYFVLNHNGQIVYEVTIPDDVSNQKLVANDITENGFLELQGVVGEYLYIIQVENQQYIEYLVNYITNEWIKL